MSENEEVLKNVPPTVEQPETTDLGYLRRLEKSVALLSKIAAVSVFSVVGSFCVVLALLPLKKTETVRLGSGVHAPPMVQNVRGTYELEQSRQSVAVLRKTRIDAGHIRSDVGIDPGHGSHLAG